MRITLLILALFIQYEYKAQWTLTPCPTTNNLTSMHFGGQNIGYAVGLGGVVLKTTDQGNNWGILNLNTTADLSSIHCSSNDTVFISQKLPTGPNANILRTFNGGTTWSVTPFNFYYGTVTCVYSKPPNLVCAVGTTYIYSFSYNASYYYGQVSGSKNNAVTFPNNVSIGMTTDMNSVFFVDTLVGYACGATNVHKTTNGGNSWQHKSYAGGNAIHFVNNNVGYIAGYNGLIRKTTDGGVTWTTQVNLGGTNHLRSIYFTGLDTGCVVGDNGMILGTADGGNNWYIQSSGTTQNLRSVHFTNSSTGYIVGDNGTILKTTHSPVGIKEMNKNLEGIFIYPNPVNDYITVDHKNIEGSIILYDITGKELLNKKFEGASNNLDLQKLSSGLYFIKVQSSSDFFSKKIVKE